MRVFSSRAARLLLFARAILASAAGVSYATGLATRAAPSAVINGCFKTMSGDLRVIDASTESCLPSETAISSPFNAPIHIEIYADGALVAGGDTNLTFPPSPGHTYEVHVSGPGPALYLLQVF